MNDQFKYSIEVYEDYALIKGSLPSSGLLLLLKLCKNEGFKHLSFEEKGFKLTK